MTPEIRGKEGEITAANETGRHPSDIDLVRSAVGSFFAENYDSDRNPAHSERVINILRQFSHDTEGMQMAALIHDVVDHGVVNPKNNQLDEEAKKLIGNLYEQVENKDMFLYAIGCGISASNWESEVAEAWRYSALEEISKRSHGDESDIESAILFGAISKNNKILGDYPSDMIDSVLRSNRMTDLDTKRLRGAMTKLDVEGLVIKAAEIMDNLDHPPGDNLASTWRDCTEVFNCYGPALDLFGFKELASELRGKALEFHYGDSGGHAQHQRYLSEKYFEDVEGQIQSGIDSSGHLKENLGFYPLRVKSEGSIRQKLHEGNYADVELVPDGLASRIIVPDDMTMEEMKSLALDVRLAMIWSSAGKVEARHSRGDIPFEIREKKNVGYSAIHLTFMYQTPDGPVPYELQFVTQSQDFEHEVGRPSHTLFKIGITDPYEHVIDDIQHMYARANFLQTQVTKPELNPNTWAQIIKYLPEMNTPLHKAFVLNDSAEGKTVLVPPRLSTLDLSELTHDIETESELDAIFLPPDKLEVDHFFELISFIDPGLANDPRIIEAVEFLQSLNLKPRKDGEPTLEGHLLPTAVNAAILATISGEHLKGSEIPSEFLAKTITSSLLHDTVEASDNGETSQNITKEDISRKFGSDIGETVSSLTTFREDEIPNEYERRTEYAKKIASDPKAFLIKFSDRMQNHQTDLVRLNEGVEEDIKQKIFEYFEKTDRHLSKLFDTLPEEYKRVKDMVWRIAEHFGYESNI